MEAHTMSELLTPAQTSEKLGVTISTLESWRCRKTYRLPYARVGRLIRYRAEDVEKFIQSRLVTPGEKAKPGRKKAA
jgi:predicted site-specific integrase-resolvase